LGKFYERLCRKLESHYMKTLKRRIKKILQVFGYFLVSKGKPDSPFNKTKGTKEGFLKLALDASLQEYKEVKDYEDLTGFKVDEAWLNELALHTQIVIKKSKLCYVHGRVIYSALSKYLSTLNEQDKQGLTVIETGTARGFSSLCMAKALQDNNSSGKVLTFDLISNQEKMFWNCIDDLEGKKTRLKLLDYWKDLVDKHLIFIEGDTRETLKSCSAGRVNFAFLDGAHTYKDVMFEFFQIKDKQIKGDVIVYDDYSPNIFPGIVEAVDHICKDHGYERHDISSEGERAYVIATKQ